MENLYDIIGVSPSVSERRSWTAHTKSFAKNTARSVFRTVPREQRLPTSWKNWKRAYSEIKRARSEYKSYGQDSEQAYAAIEEALKNGDINKAQEMLDNLTPRTAEWHYLQSIVFYKKNWLSSESKKQLEFALSLRPAEHEIQRVSLEKLDKILASNAVPPEQMRTTSAPAGNGYTAPAGNGTCTGSCCGRCVSCQSLLRVLRQRFLRMRRANKIALAGVMGAIASALSWSAPVYLPVTLTLSVVSFRSGGNTRVDIREKRRLLHSNRRSCRRSVHDYLRQIFLCSSVCGFFRAVYNRQSVCRQKQIVRALQMAYKIRRPGNRARASGIAHLFVLFGELGALHVARMVFVGVFACAASGACAV